MSSRWLSPLAALVFVLGCAGGPIRQLHPHGGNEFTLFPQDVRAPPPITCAGETEERFACFRKELQNRAGRLDVAGALAVAAPDGSIHALARTDSLNQPERTITEDTRFPAASVTKMFVAAATVSLSEAGMVDLQQPISRYLPELTSEAGVGRATLHQLLTHTSGLSNPRTRPSGCRGSSPTSCRTCTSHRSGACSAGCPCGSSRGWASRSRAAAARRA